MRKITIVLISLLCGFVLNQNAQPVLDGTKSGPQIEFLGMVSQGEGTAGWYADGTGPELAGIGHMVPGPGFTNIYYYGASHDYITNNPNHSAFHFMAGMTGFPEFGQALNNSGYVISQVRVKFGLNSVKDDIEGEDWFTIDNFHYANFYDCYFTIELNGEPMFSGFFNYSNTFVDTTGSNFIFRSSYSPLLNISSNSSAGVQAVAQAFLNDLAGREIKITFENTPGSAFSGNGRTGAYYNIINGVLEVGNPEIPWKGMVADHEGFAGWDADGTGPEELGNGHGNNYYYGASLDYDDIDPDSTACLGHFITGSTGFINTLLQLEYRGFEIGDLRLKMGLTSLGPDIQGKDWNQTAFSSWSNSYNTVGTIELSGEPILYLLMDTNTTSFSQSVGHFWSNAKSSAVYDISQNASLMRNLSPNPLSGI
ncbi:MAG: hypothetical protein K9H64_00030 [Bacteroidales bacterium]|nr:hypothetical protein [Bacteroidales bacterium]MCF8454281.1 hypothetical protein [Bacteroidales bacterium]